MTVGIFDIGSDTVTLVKRVPVIDGQGLPVVDSRGVPTSSETRISKTRCSLAQHPATEEVAGVQVAVIKAVAHLVVDADTEALSARDAIEFSGRVFELQGPGIRRDDLDGNPDHVRAEAIWAQDVSIGELVTIIPPGQRDLDGNYAASGAAVTVIARAITAGNSARRWGVAGETVTADYTIVLDPDTAISEQHWIVVRGRQCRVLVSVQTSQWSARNAVIVLAQARSGGA